MYELQRSLQSQLNGIAGCHKSCFPNSLSGKLGTAYGIKSMEWFLAGENRFLFHVINDNAIVGYCGGFISMYKGDGSTSGIIQYAMPQAIKGIIKRPWLLFNKEVIAMYPLITRNIIKKIFPSKRNISSAAKRTDAFEKKTGLVVIGVHPKHRGHGVFEMLMAEFEKQTTQRNIHKMTLSVKKNNDRAINAYRKVGWKVFKEHDQSWEMMKIPV